MKEGVFLSFQREVGFVILARGRKVLLRDAVQADADAYMRWMRAGEWEEPKKRPEGKGQG